MPPRRRKLETVLRWDFVPQAGLRGAPVQGPAHRESRAGPISCFRDSFNTIRKSPGYEPSEPSVLVSTSSAGARRAG
eukprot:8402604-Alexandrium_andersonii.AAC.1